MSVLDVLCVGVATLDRIATVEVMPGSDERVLSTPLVTAGGGPAATAAVTLARAGVRVGFCGVVGDDAAGRTVRDALVAEGVDVTHLRLDRAISTAESVIVVTRSTGERAIITTPSCGPAPSDIPTQAAAWLHVDQTGYAPTVAALAGATARPKLSVDAGNPIPGFSAEGVDLYAPTLIALRRQFPADTDEASFVAASAAGARSVVATDGDAGSLVLTADGVVRVEPFRTEIVSTMGAGDVFHGGLLAALVDGFGLAEATVRANATAALSCGALDGRSGVPTRAELDRYLSESTAAADRTE